MPSRADRSISPSSVGIVTGVDAAVAMMEIGAGSSAAIQKTFSAMGANVLNLIPGAASSAGASFGPGSATPENTETILRDGPAIRDVVPLVHARTQVVYGNRNWVPSYIYGSTPSYWDVQNRTIAEGEPFTERDVLNANGDHL